LQGLRSQVEAAISAKLGQRRSEIESELAKLDRLGGRTRAAKTGRGRMGPVAPKYRNPENPAETWAGRGLKPRWLTAALKGGKKLEDFLIAETTKASVMKQPKKIGKKMRKAGK
jgi:DNA-binding protein H-NS